MRSGDREIGRVLDALEKNGFSDDTIVVYSADHGLAVGSHGLLGKQNLYEHSMGAPLIFKGPGIPANRSSEALVYLLDIFPTLADAVGVTPPDTVEGHSLAPIWRGDTDFTRRSLFTAYEKGQRAVLTDRWKLIRYPHINHTQLFDLDNDPHELRNLAAHPAHASRVNTLMALLESWQRVVDDDTPLTSSDPKPMGIDLSDRQRKPDRHQPEWIVKKYF